MSTFKGLSVIIPVIRETTLFEETIREVLASCDSSDIEEFIVMIHPENTAKDSLNSIEAMRYIVKNAGIQYHVIPQKLPGVGGAVRDGIDVAKGSHILFICADKSNNPEIVSKFIEMQKKYPDDCINGSRYIEGGTLGTDYKLPKKIWNYVANKGLHLLYPYPITDFSSGIRSLPAAIYQSLIMVETGHPWAVETTFKLLRMGVPFHEIPLVQSGGSQSGYLETLQYLRPMIYCRFMRKDRMQKDRGELLYGQRR